MNGLDHMKFPTAVIDEVLKAKSEYASDDFIVGYRLSPEEAESPGISMEITEQLINTITEKSIDYVHISLEIFIQLQEKVSMQDKSD